MGWSWALFFCHDAMSDAMSGASRELGLGAALVGHRDMPVQMSRRRAVAAPYVDN